MNLNRLIDRLPAPLRRRQLLVAVAAVLVFLALTGWLLTPKTGDTPTAFFEVRRGDFTVSFVEPGTLAAVNEVSIRNEVEGVARIIYIVPEGSFVKQGDLLVQLDSSQAEDQVNQQRIGCEKARFAFTNAEAQLEIQRSATNSDISAATLRLTFAELDLQKFVQGQSLVDAVEASNKWVSALAQLAVNQETYNYSSNLAAKGYETKQRVDSDRLSVINLNNSAIMASNSIWILQQFDLPKQREQYESAVLEAKRELDRAVLQSQNKMAQCIADLLASSNTLVLNQKKLERDEKNLKATRIDAPQEGLVVYPISDSRFSSESLIEEGATVRNRQELIKLPDTSKMEVNLRVHESHVGMVRPGQPAFVVLDSLPDQRFQGYVDKVGLLPDTQARWGNPNLKVYKTDVLVTDPLPGVKPGVSARAEILVTNITDALSVPIQAVTTLKGRQVCYVANGKKTTPVPVQVGMFNTRFIEVLSGLKEGDRVLLSPPFDVQDKDLDGAVLAAEERSQAARTNQFQRPASAVGPTNNLAGPQSDVRPPGGIGQDGRVTGMAGEAQGGGRRGRPSREELLKQFDKNGDGELDEAESEAMRGAFMARFGGQGGPGGPRFNREEMIKRFDKNNDGELNDDERTAMREALRAERGGDSDAPPDRGGLGGQGAPQDRNVEPRAGEQPNRSRRENLAVPPGE